MSTSKYCKKAGLKSVIELSQIIEEPSDKMYYWFEDKRKLFDTVLIGAVLIKTLKDKSIKEIFEWLVELKKDESK